MLWTAWVAMVRGGRRYGMIVFVFVIVNGGVEEVDIVVAVGLVVSSDSPSVVAVWCACGRPGRLTVSPTR